MTVAQQLADTIRRSGPIPFDQWMEVALYGEPDGFYTAGGGAGRAGRDFVTSPEVGSLFGALVARAIDEYWERLGRIDPFFVVEVGAGRGTLARNVLRAQPACASALRYVMVERSQALREMAGERLPVEPAREVLGPVVHGADPDEPPEVVGGIGPVVTALAELPALSLSGVVFANELFDNLPFRIAHRHDHGWSEVRVTVADDRFSEVLVPADDALARALPSDVPTGTRLPVPTGMTEWLRGCAGMLRRGWLIVVDYTATVDELVHRPADAWLRTYAAHGRAGDPLSAPGSKDITADVAVDALRSSAERAGFVVETEQAQAEWLRDLGIDAMADSAASTWHATAAVGDLDSLKARSWVNEAAALTDPAGLGAHGVAVLRRR